MSDHDEPLKEAWQRLTAALLVGALAAGGEENVEVAQESLRDSIDGFPAERILEAEGSQDALGLISGRYAQGAWQLLDGMFGGPVTHRSSVSPISSTSTRR